MASGKKILRQVADKLWQVGHGRPRIAILGGVHGNELAGIDAVRCLVDRFAKPEELKHLCGELTIGIGNPEAVAQNARFLDTDLNRCFLDSEFVDSVSSSDRERIRASVLAPRLRGLDVLLDLHSTNKPSAPFVRLPGDVMDMTSFRQVEEMLLSALPPSCSITLWDPQGLIAKGAMSDEFALRHSGVSSGAFVCYESGQAADRSSTESILAAVEHLFRTTGMLPRQQQRQQPQLSNESEAVGRSWKHFEIFQVFSFDDAGFEWVNGHGVSNFQAIPPGEVFGRRLKTGEELTSPAGLEESYMVFPKVESLWAKGRPLGWLARRIDLEKRGDE
eukprot:TRINITY_DN10468_c0_g1_i1.p1 TRINITY_DN10468_c0_g1~~TRINITY_DN10468_c0_g1_i1.p1  ORF type:complete len:333 (+),score=53.30 TRINITY_DN10468_c0_g1_i1:57-1055(+)